MRRAQSIHDFETWQEDNVTNTINPFDTGDVRATDIVIHPIQATVIGRSDEAGPQGRGFGDDDDPMFTLNTADRHAIAFYSTGGGNDAPALDVSPALKVGSSLDIASPPAVLAFSAGNSGNSYGIGLSEDVTPPLRAGASGTNQTPTINAASVVRRLTPLECERLQGFPDDWTAERFDYKKQQVVPQADSARYKQMGNAVAVPVFAWVLGRLAAAHELLTEQEDVA